ncbi:MAG: hypothetical protein QXN59_01500, partial [Candidatus Micrarchaeaceae archaeon]
MRHGNMEGCGCGSGAYCSCGCCSGSEGCGCGMHYNMHAGMMEGMGHGIIGPMHVGSKLSNKDMVRKLKFYKEDLE